MRKLIIEIRPKEKAKERQSSIFSKIHSYEVLEVLKMDYEEKIYVDLIEFKLKEHVSIENLKSIGNMEILSILKSEGNKHTCLVKGHQPGIPSDTYKELDLNLIYTRPSLISEDKVVVSCIGNQENLVRFIDIVKNIGEVSKMRFKKVAYQKKYVLSVLTEKQKEILVAAFDSGYYGIPKKISSERLSEKLNISKPTLLEHLRKAEKRIFSEILAGYSD
ncbi:MAG: helix-turn-helix domain-containing protein [Candidatus Saliniplasma sp.]